MFEELCEFMKRGKISRSQYQEFKEIDREINKFYFLLWKAMILGMENPSVINNLKTDYSSLVHTWWTGMNLEKIGDNLKRVAKIIAKKEMKNQEDILSFFKGLEKSYIKVLNAFYRKDKKSALEVANNKNKLYKESDSVCKDKHLELKNEFNGIISHLHYISKCIMYFIK